MNYEPTNPEIFTNANQFLSTIQGEQPGVYIIKPRVLLSIIEDKFGIPTKLNLSFPSSEIGSITLLEAAMLVALGKLVGAKTIFEFGTFLGYTTNLFVQNFPDSKIYTLDLPVTDEKLEEYRKISKSEALTNDVVNDDFLRGLQTLKGPIYLQEDDGIPEQVSLLKGDSLKYDRLELNLQNSVDLIFVDGGHEANIIESDTRNADYMSSEKSVVIWHDFNSNIHGDVTDFLEMNRHSRQIFHIQSTLIAFSIKL